MRGIARWTLIIQKRVLFSSGYSVKHYNLGRCKRDNKKVKRKIQNKKF